MLPKEFEDIFNEYDEDDINLYITRADFLADPPLPQAWRDSYA